MHLRSFWFIIAPMPSPSQPDASQSGEVSLLAQLIRLVETQSPLHMNFEDLTGVTLDVPELALPPKNRFHLCEYCLLAKRTRRGHLGCNQNKNTTNRLASRRGTGFVGLCHLGMTDIVEPLVYQGRTLGVFYYGSVLRADTRPQAQARIRRYCERHKLPPGALLRQLSKMPEIASPVIEHARTQLWLVRDLALKLVEASSVPVERYRTLLNFGFTSNRRLLTPLTQAAMAYVHRRYRDNLEVLKIAEALKCQPAHLSRSFKKSAGYSLSDYIKRVRIDHAMRLLSSEQYSVGEIGFMVGFQDQSHFGKIFRSLLQMTPKEFRERYQRGDIAGKADSEAITFSHIGGL